MLMGVSLLCFLFFAGVVPTPAAAGQATQMTRKEAAETNIRRWWMTVGGLCPECLEYTGDQQPPRHHDSLLGREVIMEMYPILAYIYKLKARYYSQTADVMYAPGLLIDAGAFVGLHSVSWASHFGQRAVIGAMEQIDKVANVTNPLFTERRFVTPDPTIVTIEPHPENFNHLFQHKYGASWMGVKSALHSGPTALSTEMTQPMKVSSGSEPDETGTLNFDPSRVTEGEVIEVPTVTLESVVFAALSDFTSDSFMKQRYLKQLARQTIGYKAAQDPDKLREQERNLVDMLPKYVEFPAETPVFFLRMDLSGHEMEVMKGSETLFGGRRIKFLSFVYNELDWAITKRGGKVISAADQLETVIRYLDKRNYFCFVVFPSEMFPISFDFWSQEHFTSVSWSNIFCGQADDPDLDTVVLMYHHGPTLTSEVSPGVTENNEWVPFPDAYLEYDVRGHEGKAYSYEEAKAHCEQRGETECGGIICAVPSDHDMFDDNDEILLPPPEPQNCELRNGGDGPFQSDRGQGNVKAVSYLRPYQRSEIHHPFFSWKRTRAEEMRKK